MRNRCLRDSILTIVALASVFGPQPATSAHAPEANRKTLTVVAVPDLRISEFLFATTNEKVVRVHIVNSGGAGSASCVLRLTVRKINGISVGRVVEIKLPPLAAGKDKWVLISAKAILPNNVSLESTTFKLNADATSIVAESDEANNEVWHNL
jgi:hypothetical protein